MENFLRGATAIGFVGLSLIMYGLVLAELKKTLPKTGWEPERQRKVFNKTLTALIGWTLLISTLSLTGFISDFSSLPPRITVVLIIPLVTLLVITFSKTLKELLTHIPVRTIIRLQVFRVFVEILLWMLLLQNEIPVQMSFEGRNFDILSGLTAPVVAYFFVNNPTVLKIWNFISLALLINIVAIAILSLPSPLRFFMNEPANTIVAEFPYVFLPGLLVPLAYGLHFFSLRQLAIQK